MEQPTAAASEKSASQATSQAPNPKPRSCVICRSRKVRCDKQSPCSNCRRANLACVLPPQNRPPRWARQRLAMNANAAAMANSKNSTLQSPTPDPAAAQVMVRMQYLENLVVDLSGQLERANASVRAGSVSAAGGSSVVASTPGSSSFDPDQDPDQQRQSKNSPSFSVDTNDGNVQPLEQFGRLVLQDANRSRYVSSGFWSRVDQEIGGLNLNPNGSGTLVDETSDDEASPSPGKTPSTQELNRTPSERQGFFFGHNPDSSSPNLREFHPLPSQIPYLLDVFFENVNSIFRTVHVPTVSKMAKRLNIETLTPSNEALMFAIYYAAIASMEEDDVMTNFGVSKSDLKLKYRVGLERALANADFLNVPDLVLIQAISILLFLIRRHDSPRFVWILTGLLIRMGQSLGLHRDGSNFPNLTPYEIEMRRRVWWGLYILDFQASEDEGSDIMILPGSFDTKLPLNINEADIDPATTQTPISREGITDMTFLLVTCELGKISKEMIALSTAGKNGSLEIEEQEGLLNKVFQQMDRSLLQYTDKSTDARHWIGSIVARTVMAKMASFVYLPLLFSSPSEQFSNHIKNKLLIASIEIAEYNHALYEDQTHRHWRWLWKTYSRWYATVYLLIETSRRPWSPIVERAWVALHSQWLIPPQKHMHKNMRMWLPLRKLIAKAKGHRESELERLRLDPQAAESLKFEDERMPTPTSFGTIPSTPGSSVVEMFRQRWSQLLAVSPQHSPNTWSTTSFQPMDRTSTSGSNPYFHPIDSPSDYFPPTNPSSNFIPTTSNTPSNFTLHQTTNSSPYDTPAAIPNLWSIDPNFACWPLNDADIDVSAFGNAELDMNMDLDSELDWFSWVQSNKNKGDGM